MSRTRCRKLNPPSELVVTSMTPDDVRRFFNFVGYDDDTGCWPWNGTRDKNGYGQFWFSGRMCWAHRIAEALFKHGRIAAGREVDHTKRCRLGARCVCPWHLRKLSPIQNATDGGRRRHAKAATSDTHTHTHTHTHSDEIPI